MVELDAPAERFMPLAEVCQDLVRGKRKRRSAGVRTTLAAFSAAVTVLKKGRLVEDVIAELATPNGINRGELTRFRDRLHRGKADVESTKSYELALALFEGRSKSEIAAILSEMKKRFCT
jgi:hypothetical protein